ncbi:hypothetical protein KQI52_01495 [bacterium]|nr:hypothetical protein [bacterium]
MPRFLITLMLLATVAAVMAACSPNDSTNNEPPAGLDPVVLGVVQDDRITEASGMIASRRNPGWLWVHNDSGDIARLYAISAYGDSLAELQLDGIDARDWEDIAIGPGPGGTDDYLYVGDIGDNDNAYKNVVIYRFREPEAEEFEPGIPLLIEDVERFDFMYPESPRDAETLLVDPFTSDMYIMTKRLWPVQVYRAVPIHTDRPQILQHVADITGPPIAAGDISRDGRHVIVKTYDAILHWYREDDMSIPDLFAQPPDTLPYVTEPQGEALAFNLSGTGYYTVSEETRDIAAAVSFYPFNPDTHDGHVTP